MLAVAGFGIRGLNQIYQAQVQTMTASDAIHNHMEGDMMHEGLRGDVYMALSASERKDRQSVQAALQAANEHGEAFRAALAANEKLELPREIKTALEDLKPSLQRYITQAESIARLAGSDPEKAREKLPAFDAAFSEMEVKQEKISDLIINYNDRMVEQSAATLAIAKRDMFGAVVAALLFCIGMSYFIIRRISRDLASLREAAQNLAVGDIDQKIAIEGRHEVGLVADSFREMIAYQQQMAQVAEAIAAGDLTTKMHARSDRDRLGQALERMVQDLRRLIGEIMENVGAVTRATQSLSVEAEKSRNLADTITRSIQEMSAATEQSARSSQEIARGSEQQARSATDAAGAMERLHQAIDHVQRESRHQQEAVSHADQGMQEAARVVQSVTASAEQMAQAVQKASETAHSGGASVEQTITRMSRIQQQVEMSSEKVTELGQRGQEIGAIAETISQIAEQTNLLALNAAIEAARAGEHGKGFAVVADEVRKLAERSAAATKEITTLIAGVRSGVEQAVQAMEKSRQEVAAGAANSEEAGRALEAILRGMETVTGEVNHLTQAAREMAAAVSEVQESVSRVRQAAAENERQVEAMAHESDMVSGAITSVASVSEETAAGAQEMSAAVQEVSASASEVSGVVEEQKESADTVFAAAEDLSRVASLLKQSVERFRMETSETASDSQPAQGLRLAA
jgi:methyl-accepting chemotaxis protein